MKRELIVVTGATSGIGEATAKLFSERGYPLLLIGRRAERLEALGLKDAICAKLDVTDTVSFQAAVARAQEQYGPVGCLVNNAGVMLLGKVHRQDPAEWRRMFDVNLLGMLNGVRAVLDRMRERKLGTVINISSVAGRKTFANHAVYCATKFGVHALTEALREEYAGDGVRFVTVAPGVVETELLGHTSDDRIRAAYEQWKKQLGQALLPEDVARAIVFAYEQPPHVCIREIVLAPTSQEM